MTQTVRSREAGITLNAHHTRSHVDTCPSGPKRGLVAWLDGNGACGTPLCADRGSRRGVSRAVFKFRVRSPGPSREYLINLGCPKRPLILALGDSGARATVRPRLRARGRADLYDDACNGAPQGTVISREQNAAGSVRSSPAAWPVPKPKAVWPGPSQLNNSWRGQDASPETRWTRNAPLAQLLPEFGFGTGPGLGVGSAECPSRQVRL